MEITQLMELAGLLVVSPFGIVVAAALLFAVFQMLVVLNS